MNIADLLKKNFILVPVIASVLVGTFTGVRYIVNLTDTINNNQAEIVNLQRDLKVAQEKITDQNTRLTSAESTWQMAENLYRQLADQVGEHSYDIKDLIYELYGGSQDELQIYCTTYCNDDTTSFVWWTCTQ